MDQNTQAPHCTNNIWIDANKPIQTNAECIVSMHITVTILFQTVLQHTLWALCTARAQHLVHYCLQERCEWNSNTRGSISFKQMSLFTSFIGIHNCPHSECVSQAPTKTIKSCASISSIVNVFEQMAPYGEPWLPAQGACAQAQKHPNSSWNASTVCSELHI